MSQTRNRSTAIFKFALVFLLPLMLGACAFGTTGLNITHEPLDKIENKKEGNILIKQFTDTRSETQYIGNKRNGFGMVLGHMGTVEGVKLEVLLTEYFAEALKEAGYNAVIQGIESDSSPGQIKFDAIVDGEITEFWLDLYMAVWHNVEVKVKVLDPVNQNVVWEKMIEGEQTNTLWWGVSSEFEQVINQALTKALNQAGKEFASDEFYQSFKNKEKIISKIE